MEYILKNNLKLIYKKTISNLTSISISIDAGAGKEEELLGLAHATEHMVYKGTKKRSEREINKELSNIFGFQNAMTNYPYVIYYGTALSEDFERAIELFSDIIINPSFEEKGFKEEMDVIKEELKEWDEDLEQFCEDKQFLNTFDKRRIKYPIIGTTDSLNKIRLKDIKAFYNENYSPKNTSIAVVTSLEFEEVKSIINKYFESWEKIYLNKGNEYEYENINEGIYENYKAGINTCRVQVVFPIHDLNQDEIKALRIFNEYFGEGVNSVLFDNLRTKNGLVYDILTNISNEKYIKLYKINFNTSRENLNRAIELVNRSIEDIEDFKKNIKKDNINNFIKSMKIKRWFKEEKGIILAKELSTYSSMYNDYRIYSKEFEDIEKLDIDFIYKVARKILKRKSIQIISN